MSHKRVSQLTSLTAAEVQGGDLFYIIDVSVREGKKIEATALADYLAASGSLNAITATTAATASYILGSGVQGSVTSSLTANLATAAISASWASASISSSNALTASFALNAAGNQVISASWASASISSSFAQNAASSNQTSFLAYSGGNNGTASYAINTLNVVTASFAKTASYLSGIGSSVATASYAERAGNADVATISTASNFLNFTIGVPNGTASYALSAGGYINDAYNDYGLWLATSQSISSSQLDFIQITASIGNPTPTVIEAFGTVIVPYTASIPVSETLDLVIKDRDNGTEFVIDTTPVYLDMSRTVNNWNDVVTGSVKIPYTLAGSSSLYGRYMLFVTSSTSKIQIEPSRLNRFTISSTSDTFASGIDEQLLFNLTPSASLIEFTSSAGGPFTDNRSGLLATGSTQIYNIDINNESLTSVRYVWSLSNLKSMDCSGNPGITVLGGMPNTMETMSCYSCSITNISSLVNTTMSILLCGDNSLVTLPSLPTSMSYLDCNTNVLTTLPTLPNTMSYINAGNNLLTSLPSEMPNGLTELYLHTNQLSSFFTTLPNSIVTMSIANNASIISWGAGIPGTGSVFPTTLESLDISFTQISSVPNIPAPMLYFNAISCSLSQAAMDNICSQSLSNGLSNGFIYLNGNGYVMISTENNYILPLQGLGWTIGYDGAI